MRLAKASEGWQSLSNPEYVVRANPDVIMVGDRNYEGMEGRPGWSGIRAIRERHVCVFTVAQSDVVVRPGPRMAESARILAQCLQAMQGRAP